MEVVVGKVLSMAALVLSAAGCVDTNLSDELNWTGAAQQPNGGKDGGGVTDSGGGPYPSDGGDRWDPWDGSLPDTTPPWLVAPSGCAPTEVPVFELCASTGPFAVALRFWASEPVTALARVDPTGELDRSDSPATDHHLLIAPLPSAVELSIMVEVQDRAGLQASAGPVTISTPPAAPTVVINEILFDPLGTEPNQEFVELLNHGPSPISVDGWILADEGGEDVLMAPAQLGPGAYAIVVSNRYEPGSGGDPPPGPGTMVIPLEGPIGAAGLRNDGEALTLFDDLRAVVSSYPALEKPPSSGASVERTNPVAPDGDPAGWVGNLRGVSTPGAPNDGASE